ncbi:MAG: hypothetical protein WD426_13580 [Anditalea sp.]
MEDPFGVVFEIYTHSYELTYSAGAYEERLIKYLFLFDLHHLAAQKNLSLIFDISVPIFSSSTGICCRSSAIFVVIVIKVFNTTINKNNNFLLSVYFQYVDFK